MDELKKYVQKTAKDKIILGVFGAVFAAAAVILFTQHSWVLFIIMLLCAAVLFIGAFTASATDKKFFDDIQNSTRKDEILADFAAAVPYANDEIRMGEYYIFTKKLTSLINYEDIISLRYFEHHDMETHNTEAGIAVSLKKGAGRTLCNLYGDDTQMQAEKIYNAVLSRNASVEIKA